MIVRCTLRAFCSFAAVLALATASFGETDVDTTSEKSLVQGTEAPAKTDSTKYELRYKMERGDVMRYEISHRASIRTTIDETTQAAQTRTDSTKAWKVTDVLPNGDIEFTNIIEKVHMVNQLPDKDPTEYDSSKDKIPPAGFEDAAKAVGVPLSMMRITPQGKVVRRDLKVRNQGAENDAQIVLRLPEEKVAIGDTWDEPFEITVALAKGNGTKAIQTRRHHKLTDVTNDLATIAVTYQILSPIDAQIETQVVQRLMQGEVKFDIEKGQIVSQQMDIDKSIIGFAGPTSSMQYLMKMEEKLLPAEVKPTAKAKSNSAPIADSKSKSTTPAKPQTTATANKSTPAAKNTKQPAQTANRQRTTAPNSRTIRR